MAAESNPFTSQVLDLPTLGEVTTSRAGRVLAMTFIALVVALPFLLTIVPWQQNVRGSGRAVALDPRERVQTIPAPVTGRLVELLVQEGTVVEKGDVIAKMEDQDPSFFLRLQQQLEFARQKVEAGRNNVQSYQDQVISLQNEKEFALQSARLGLSIAIQKVREAEETLEAREATLEQLEADYKRKKDLFDKGLMSELIFQVAERDFRTASADVERAKASVQGARDDELAKMADIDKIEADRQARIQSATALIEDAKGKLQAAQREYTEAESVLKRQETQTVFAPMDGTVLSIFGANSQDLISRGAPLIEFMPKTEEMAVELFMRGIDAPLITKGRAARLQFEGWPAVQFAGWPSIAIGTFGGLVHIVDSEARADGRVRVVIVPDPAEVPWPKAPVLRQGVKVSGWVQLETVSAGYEIWRQLNAFPPTVAEYVQDEGGTGMSFKDAGKDGKDK